MLIFSKQIRLTLEEKSRSLRSNLRLFFDLYSCLQSSWLHPRIGLYSHR